MTKPRRRWVLRRTGERPVNTNAERRGNRQQRARLTRQWRNDFRLLALAEQIPPLDRIRVIIVPHYKTRRSLPDTGACSPSAKAGIDGIVDAGVIPDDTPAHVVEHIYRPPRVEGWDGLALIIEEDLTCACPPGTPVNRLSVWGADECSVCRRAVIDQDGAA